MAKLTASIGHADRAGPLRLYCAGLLLPGERKSVEPMAAQLAPDRVAATHQQMHHFVASAPWIDGRVLATVREYVLPVFQAHGGVKAWIVDDTGIPKKGRHSVGVARQYCGVLGKQENCQVAVSLSVANARLSLPIAYELYLPESWAEDEERRKEAGVPPEVRFLTKPAIAVSQVRAALEQGIPRGVVLADAGYGTNTGFRDEITGLQLEYVVGVQPTTTVWPAAEQPQAAGRAHGRPRLAGGQRSSGKPVAVRHLAQGLGRQRYRTVQWRLGSRGVMASRFAAVRIRPAHQEAKGAGPRPEEWLLVEWPKGEKEPTKYWLSTLPQATPLPDLARTAMTRWRIERDYEELKGELGLDHYEGRSWRGFHHHATLCIAAYGFLVVERGLFSPSGISLLGLPIGTPGLPTGFRPRGAPDPGGAARALLRGHAADSNRPPSRGRTGTLSDLPAPGSDRP